MIGVRVVSSSCAFITHGLLSRMQEKDLVKIYNVLGVFYSNVFARY